MAPLSMLIALAFAAFSWGQSTPPTQPSTVLKILCIIKPTTTIAGSYGDGVMNQTLINDFANGFLNIWPEYIYNITGGTVQYETSVVVSPDALTAMDPNPTYEGSIDQSDVQGDIDRYNVTVANYDHVLFIGSQPANALWTNANQLDGIGWTSIEYSGNSPYVQDWSAGNTHETLWALQWWFTQSQYMGTGQSPIDASDPGDDGTADILNGGYYNYTDVLGGNDGIPIIGKPYEHWTKWYKDFLNGQICMQDANGNCQPGARQNLGLGPNAWKWPSRREAHHGLSAGYLATSVTWPGEPAVLSTFTGGPTFDATMNNRPWTTGGGNWFGPGPNLANPSAAAQQQQQQQQQQGGSSGQSGATTLSPQVTAAASSTAA